MQKTIKPQNLKKTIAAFLFGTAILLPGLQPYPVYAETQTLIWSPMEYETETTKTPTPAPTKSATPPALQNTNSNSDQNAVLLQTIAAMQQQQQNLVAMIAAMQPKNSDAAIVAALQQQQQQQQQFLTTILQMQQQQQTQQGQQTLLLMAAALQNKNAQAETNQQKQLELLLTYLGQQDKKDNTNNGTGLLLPISTFATSNPTPDNINSLLTTTETVPSYETTETKDKDYVPYQRARLAPPDDPLPEKSPSESITEAIQDAALEGYYRDSMAVFNYGDAALYKIYCKDGYLTIIRLQPGETIVSINGGDTSRWVVDSSTAGTGNAAQAQVLLKPVRAGLDTNFVIITDKHTYQLQAKSTSWYNPIVSWTYPQEERNLLKRNEEKQLKNDRENISLGVRNPESLNFNYKIKTRGEVDAWKPQNVFDDGRKVYIKMTSTMKNGEAPALLLKDSKGKTSIVNYRMKNEYYIVDRLFKEAELRIGKNYVRITRTDPLPREE